MSEGRAGVVVVGSLHYDIMVRAPYLPRQGETLMGSAWWWKPGGKGGNQAMAAARHGAAVEMIGALGADDFGQRLRACLAEAGVGLAHIRELPQGSGMSVALVEGGGDYSAVVVSGANLAIDAAQIEASAVAISSAKILLLQNEISEAANLAAARIARASGGFVILNAAPARPLAPELGQLVQLLIVNAIEAEMLGAAPISSLETAAAAARHLNTPDYTVIVTAGAHGLAGASSREVVTLPAYPVAKAETHGAGDTFAGALAARLAADDTLDRAMRYANAAAALHVGAAESARSRITPAGVEQFLASQHTS